MTDTFSKKKRSEIMRAVKSKGNKSTELKMIAVFKELGWKGWRRNYKLFGKPDFVFPKLRVAVFVDGCFWHGHDCRNTKPASNADYWQKKIQRNRHRDRAVTEQLTQKNWRVIRIWECALKKGELEKLQPIARHFPGN
ncbi:MAG: DNA mismatch endonuclease Vsr [Chloroflexi bacterium]|nr:DNA mismatch endonuclease Vsr [Chloroflexota bacterium]